MRLNATIPRAGKDKRMKYVRVVECPICGTMNNVPGNLEALVKTEVFRGGIEKAREQIKRITQRLHGVSQDVRDRVLTLLQTTSKSDLNDWIDVECLSTDQPHGRHTFRYHTGTGKVSP